MRIGILETGHAPDEFKATLGTYPDMFKRLLGGQGFEFDVYSVVDMDFPGDVHDADGWLITGSKHGVYEDLPFIAPLEEFIRQAYAAHIPVVGVCFGHQIMAQAMGGKVEKFGGGWAVGHTVYDLDGDKVALNAWHQDQVITPPKEAQVIGSTDFCKYAALAYDDRMLSVQPHPEYSGAVIDGLIRLRGRGNVPDPLLDEAEGKLDLKTDSDRLAAQFTEFFKKKRS